MSGKACKIAVIISSNRVAFSIKDSLYSKKLARGSVAVLFNIANIKKNIGIEKKTRERKR
jgi:hypothetical protein